MPFQILTRENGTSIAYNKLVGNPPGLIFMSGFMSDMNGSKALALEQHCQERGLAFLRFDYMGHGNSSGNFADGTIGLWAQNALTAFDELTEGPQIITGSSMGGWMMILTAVSRPERVAGLVGIAAAPDFTEDLLPKQLTEIQLSKIQEDGFVVIPSEYEIPYTITKKLLDDGTQHLVLRNEIPLDCPVRLLHGLEDTSVPWKTALKIQNMVRSKDVEVTLIKNGDHRLSREEDLEKLKKTVMEIV
jgi:pimeloyl-ACP methyl ester carboxylesterase